MLCCALLLLLLDVVGVVGVVAVGFDCISSVVVAAVADDC